MIPKSSRQNALAAFETYRQALTKPDADIKISANNNVKIASLFDRIRLGISDYFTHSSPAHRRELAKGAIEQKFITEAHCIQPKLSKEQESDLLHCIRSLTEFSSRRELANQSSGSLLNEALKGTRDTSVQDLLLNIRAVNDRSAGVSAPYMWQSIKQNGLQLNLAREIASTTKEFKQQFSLRPDIAFKWANSAHLVMKKYPGTSKEQALKIIETAGSLLRAEVANKSNAIARARALLTHSDKLNQVAQSLQIKHPKWTQELAWRVAQNRLFRLIDVAAALPKGLAVEIDDESTIDSDILLSADETTALLQEISASASKYPLDPNTGLMQQLTADANRMHCKLLQQEDKQKIKTVSEKFTFERGYGPAIAEANIQALKDFSGTMGAAKMLSYLTHQGTPGAALVALTKHLGVSKDNKFIPLPIYTDQAPDKPERGDFFSIQIEKTTAGDFILRFHYLQRDLGLLSLANGATLPINQGLGLRADVAMADDLNTHSTLIQLALRLKHEDIEQGIFKPELETPDGLQIKLKLKPDWDIVDAEYLESLKAKA